MKLSGPLSFSELQATPWLAKRNELFEMEFPHLYQNEERRLIEQETDERASHFCITIPSLLDSENILVAYLRLVPPPYELLFEPEIQRYFTSEPQNLYRVEADYLEISRVVTHSDFRASGIEANLLQFAGLWAVNSTPYKGFIGLCQPISLRFFRRFGVQPTVQDAFRLQSRANLPYFLVKGDFPKMADAIRTRVSHEKL